MINPQWLELPMSRTNFHGPKDVRVIEIRLYNISPVHVGNLPHQSIEYNLQYYDDSMPRFNDDLAYAKRHIIRPRLYGN